MAQVTDAILRALSQLNAHKKTIYYNARLNTEGQTGVSNPIYPARFSVSLPQAFIDSVENWVMSVVRFTCTLHGLPALFVKHPVGGGSNPTATVYSFTIKYNGSSVTQTVNWQPADASLRQMQGTYDDMYWYEYNYVRMGTFLNAALSAGMTALIALQPALALVPPPFFQYDAANAVFELWTPEEFLDSAATPVSLFCNEESHLLMTGYPVAPTGVLGEDAKFLIIQQPAEPTRALNGHDYVVRAQLPGSLTSWTPVRRFVITTQTLPVVAENSISQTPFGSINFVGSNPNTTKRVISDYTPNLLRGDELLNGTIEYTPTAQYRMTDFCGSGQLNAIDGEINWEDPLGGLHVYTLRTGGYFSFKVAFIEK